MKGLLRNNYYAALSNAKVFAGVMLLLGIFVAAVDNAIPSLVIGYMVSVIVGFSLSSIASPSKECATKWNTYKLTLPVKRGQIVISYYISLVSWLLVGIIFAGIVVSLSIMLHGFPFDKNTDVFMLFVMGISMSLFIGTIFFPLFYLGGEERNEVFLIISLLGSIGTLMGLSTLINILLPTPLTTMQTILSGIIVLAVAVLLFLLSYPLSVFIYSRREY